MITNTKPRDLDIIIDVNRDLLEREIFKFFQDVKKNRLGGFKITLPNIVLDIWDYDSNWATNNNLINGKNSLQNIAIGSFYNFDSLVINLRTLESFFKYYNQCITSNTLDILLKNRNHRYLNPTKEANFLRAVLLSKEFNFNLSSTLLEYLRYLLKFFNKKYSSATKRLVEYSKSDDKYSTIREKDIDSFIIKLNKLLPSSSNPILI